MTAPLTTTGPPSAPPGVTGPGDDAAPARTSAGARLSAELATTPGRLALATAVAVVACLLLGVTGFLAGSNQSAALDDAQRDTAQLVGIAGAAQRPGVADATATNAFLVGGLEPPEQRARATTTSLSAAAQALADARGDRRGATPRPRTWPRCPTRCSAYTGPGRAGPGEQPAGLPRRRGLPRPGLGGAARRGAAHARRGGASRPPSGSTRPEFGRPSRRRCCCSCCWPWWRWSPSRSGWRGARTAC